MRRQACIGLAVAALGLTLGACAPKAPEPEVTPPANASPADGGVSKPTDAAKPADDAAQPAAADKAEAPRAKE